MPKFFVRETEFNGLIVVEPNVYADDRGYFIETYNKRDFNSCGIRTEFVQDNCSFSKKGVLRGLHIQYKHPQAKLIRVVVGEVFDVVVDLRKESPTYKKWFGIILSEVNKKMLYVPEGFAHGFLTLSENAVFAYKCSDFYYAEFEAGVIWNDEELAIDWPLDKVEKLILSKKDGQLLKLKDFEKLYIDMQNNNA